VSRTAIRVQIYSRPGCHLCDDMKALVGHVAESSALRVEDIDISGNPELERAYGLEVPVLVIDGKKVAKYRTTEDALRRILRSKAVGPA
jgi:glutaredoxin